MQNGDDGDQGQKGTGIYPLMRSEFQFARSEGRLYNNKNVYNANELFAKGGSDKVKEITQLKCFYLACG